MVRKTKWENLGIFVLVKIYKENTNNLKATTERYLILKFKGRPQKLIWSWIGHNLQKQLLICVFLQQHSGFAGSLKTSASLVLNFIITYATRLMDFWFSTDFI